MKLVGRGSFQKAQILQIDKNGSANVQPLKPETDSGVTEQKELLVIIARRGMRDAQRNKFLFNENSRDKFH